MTDNTKALEALNYLAKELWDDNHSSMSEEQFEEIYGDEIQTIRAALTPQVADVESLFQEMVNYYAKSQGGVINADAVNAINLITKHLAARGLIVREGFVAVPIAEIPVFLTMKLPEGRVVGKNQRIESLCDQNEAYKCAEILHKAMIAAAQGGE